MLYEYLQHTTLAYPWLLALLGVIPLLLYRRSRLQDRDRSMMPVSTVHAFQVATWKTKFRHLPFVLRLLAIACCIMALARPQLRQVTEQTEGEGIDIMLCMDVSGSMGSADIPPSRMEVAKEVAEEFVRSRPVDRIGLVIFSGESFTQCPLTNDREALIGQVQQLESRALLKDGTVIGEGLATAVDRLWKSPAKSKVIILITDGKEDAPETRLIDPLTALDIAKSRGIKVYTIGMGAAVSAMPVTGPAKPGVPNATIDFIDEELLQRIAKETGGRYFRATDKQGLSDTYKAIDQLEKSKMEITRIKKVEERFLPFMLAALGFLFLELLLQYTVFRKFP